MKSKNTYRVRNWADYNKSLVSRGRINIWITESALKKWRYQGHRSPGGVKRYSDIAIKACHLIKEVYGLSLRSCEGFIQSLNLPIDVPCYTTLCRRLSGVDLSLRPMCDRKQPVHQLIDSTGLKIYGEGEWYRKKHGVKKYSLWAKAHVALNHDSREIVSILRSDANSYDSKYLPPLLEGVNNIACVYGDGAYDKRLCYEACYELGANLIAPTQRNARKQSANRNYVSSEALRDRDHQIDFINEFTDGDMGRAVWKQASQYHKRSLIENAMYRLKQCFGRHLQCRKEAHQECQLKLRALALNKMTRLGMPQSVAI